MPRAPKQVAGNLAYSVPDRKNNKNKGYMLPFIFSFLVDLFLIYFFMWATMLFFAILNTHPVTRYFASYPLAIVGGNVLNIFLTFCLIVFVNLFHSTFLLVRCMFYHPNHPSEGKCDFGDTLLGSGESMKIVTWITIIITNFVIVRWIIRSEKFAYREMREKA